MLLPDIAGLTSSAAYVGDPICDVSPRRASPCADTTLTLVRRRVLTPDDRDSVGSHVILEVVIRTLSSSVGAGISFHGGTYALRLQALTRAQPASCPRTRLLAKPDFVCRPTRWYQGVPTPAGIFRAVSRSLARSRHPAKHASRQSEYDSLEATKPRLQPRTEPGWRRRSLRPQRRHCSRPPRRGRVRQPRGQLLLHRSRQAHRLVLRRTVAANSWCRSSSVTPLSEPYSSWLRDGVSNADVHDLLLNGLASQSSTTAVGGGSAGTER
jgi:hypothetical protein